MTNKTTKRQIRLFRSTFHGWLAQDITFGDDVFLLKSGTNGEDVTTQFPEAESRSSLKALKSFLNRHNLREIQVEGGEEDTESEPEHSKVPWEEMSF